MPRFNVVSEDYLTACSVIGILERNNLTVLQIPRKEGTKAPTNLLEGCPCTQLPVQGREDLGLNKGY